MVLGNLIHTSCLMLRRTRLEQVGFINEALGNCGEDYDFHLRICKAGPVAYLDATFVDYEIGSPDALTSSEKMINYALHYLKTLEETVSQDGHRIKLPDGLLRKRWAAGLAWAGHEHLRVGRNMRAAGYFARSFLKEPSKPIRLLFFAATFMPAHSLIKLKAVKKRWTDT
jgi:GT2 family glycosyltransferase